MEYEKLGKMVFGSWYGLLKPILSTEYFHRLISTLNTNYKEYSVWPTKRNVFRAFEITDYRDLRVVILGQDPYSNGRANGLAFANADSFSTLSPSLDMIWKSIERDYYNGLQLEFDKTLESWSKQGVLLLNTSLTVKEGAAGSDIKLWEPFTEFVIKRLSEYDPGTIYVLWGNYAKEYKKYIDTDSNYIIESEHPAAALYRKDRNWEFSFKTVDDITRKINGVNIKW